MDQKPWGRFSEEHAHQSSDEGSLARSLSLRMEEKVALGMPGRSLPWLRSYSGDES